MTRSAFIEGSLTLLGLYYILSADYPAIALAALISILFLGYMGYRVLLFFEDGRFTPERLRVGMTWALVGFHVDTREYDHRPVRVYFILLALLLSGLVIRPVVGYFI